MSRLSFVKFVSKLGHVALADLRRWKEGRGGGERERKEWGSEEGER